jgi:hypothetical protein
MSAVGSSVKVQSDLRSEDPDVTPDRGTPMWAKYRTAGIGASCFAARRGEDPFAHPQRPFADSNGTGGLISIGACFAAGQLGEVGDAIARAPGQSRAGAGVPRNDAIPAKGAHRIGIASLRPQ